MSKESWMDQGVGNRRGEDTPPREAEQEGTAYHKVVDQVAAFGSDGLSEYVTKHESSDADGGAAPGKSEVFQHTVEGISPEAVLHGTYQSPSPEQGNQALPYQNQKDADVD